MINFKFELENKRQIFLDELILYKTYAGLLEGRPDESINADVFRFCEKRAKLLHPDNPFLILGFDFYSKDPAAPLPPIVIIGQFISYHPARDANKSGSSLTLGWFQEVTPPVFDVKNEVYISQIMWEKAAKDFNW